MNFRIVSDSSCNRFSLEGADFAWVPMKVTAGREYVDTPALDVPGMVEELKRYKSKSGSSCPNVGEWLEAFGDAKYIFGITITKYLSGSYNAACQAAEIYTQEHPDRKVCILDSLSAGPQLMLMAEKIRACDEAGDSFETTRDKVLEYQNHLHTAFCLESLNNLARNGRVSPAVAKIASVLNIRVCGTANGGQLAPAHKPRGPRKSTQVLFDMMVERGFRDGNVLAIDHCNGEAAALALRDIVLQTYPNTVFRMGATGGLCSFYAEEGGLMIAFEGGFNSKNDNTVF